jgi:hypothetical protein
LAGQQLPADDFVAQMFHDGIFNGAADKWHSISDQKF